ncbi:uncharacterized protein DUF1980 [Paenibacillus cellulosilyticus]|uniref:Uncharacterized protein DUF1980 n=1 Tax=Paenibacillus cellulosilyticus TaxID=375489 RepID=A0A2V2Z0D6_9BACL|nr:DUF1980 domain-containing protein [Paenibacillus cellulosilyticus]PWW07507.1 uncharacterized protein DUF1980 [Paenibacillus cellulosilyticus]QKS44339.1 DUF1980 domain-containing protein [Paenibacillus cellulosilyticus]
MKLGSYAAPLIHCMLRAIVLLGFALLIVQLKRTGELGLFVTPRIEQAVKLSALGLIAAGVHQTFMFLRMLTNRSQPIDNHCECGHDHHHDHHDQHHHDHDHDHTPSPARSVLLYGLFLLLLAIGFLMPHKPLDSDLNGKLGTTVHSHVKGE